MPKPKKTCKPTCQRGLSSLDSDCEQACKGGCSDLVVNGRYAALAGSQDQYDLDLPLPMMMLQDEGDVPPSTAIGSNGLVPVTQSSRIIPEHPAGTKNKRQKSRTLSQKTPEPKGLPGTRPTSYGPPASKRAGTPVREARVTTDQGGNEKELVFVIQPSTAIITNLK